MALTVEPGCYIRPGDDVPEALWNIGIRIEDDVLVTRARLRDPHRRRRRRRVAEIEALDGATRGAAMHDVVDRRRRPRRHGAGAGAGRRRGDAVRG
ncbi:MAG: hypothetical protein MZW92_11435 [Comamonadaceae bacterium]|nr:hypothetical protein [Comamonadaceae bacterium]